MDENQSGVQLLQSEEDKKKKVGLTQPASAFSSSGPSTSPIGSKVAPTGPVAPTAPTASQQSRAAQQAGPTKGTGFTGVGRYLQANVGSRLGEQIAGRVAQTGQQAAGRLGQAVTQFGKQLGGKEEATGAYGEFAKKQQAARGALERISSGQPADISSEEQAAYSSITGGDIKAPTGLVDIGSIQAQAKLASDLASATQTAAGREALLRQKIGSGVKQYGTAQSALDALILGQSAGKLASARRSAAGLERQADVQEKLAQEQARQFSLESQAAGRELSEGVKQLEKTVGSKIQSQKIDYEKGLEDLYNKIQNEISQNDISKETADIMKNLGIDPRNVYTYGLDLNQFKNLFERKQGADITDVSSAKLEQLKQLNALNALASQRSRFSEEELKQAGTTIDPVTGLSYRAEKLDALTKAQKEAVQRASEEFKSSVPKPAGYGRDYSYEHEGSPSAFGYYKKSDYNFNRDLYDRFMAGELYDPKTGQINQNFANELSSFWRNRRKFAGREGWLGLGAGKYEEYAGDRERIAALQQLIEQTTKKFKIKE